MKLQKLFWGLLVGIGAFLCLALGWFWLGVDPSPCLCWQALRSVMRTLDPAVCWTVFALFVINLTYLAWRFYCGESHTRRNITSGNLPLQNCHTTRVYAEKLKQRHQALLNRYEDPALVKFLLNREAARAYLADRVDVYDVRYIASTSAAA